ncbi:MAG: translocation/assembly module TamB domain-containing protein [Vicinamibacterales bacterium]
MGGRLGRWLALGLVAIVALVSMVLLAAHTPWARARAFAWATDFVTQYHLSLKAGELSYNALTRRVTLTDVRLAAIGHEDQPFLIAKRLEATLPWSVYRRRFAIDHLEIDGGVVDIRRDAAGVTNLPPGSSGPAPENARRLDVRGLTFKTLDVRYDDLLHDWTLTVPGIESELSKSVLGAEGSFAVRGRTTVRLKQRTLTMAPIDAKMTFDGSNVALNEVRLVSAELDAVLNGTIHRVLDATFFELALNGIVNLEPATEWAPPPVPASGVVKIAGTITGPWALPVTDLRVTGSEVAIGHERNLGVDGPVRVTMDAFSGDGMVLKPSTGGEIRAAFNVPWGKLPPSSARAEWKDLDAQSAFRLGEFAPQRIGAAFRGNGTFEFGEIRRYEIWNRAAARASRGDVPLTGELHAKLVGDNWAIEHAHQVPGLAFDGKTAGRIDNATIEATTLEGPAHAKVSDLATAANSAAMLGIDMPAIASRIHGALDAPMTLSGSFRDPKVDTTLAADALDVPLVGVIQATAHVVSDRRVATVSAIDARHGSATVKGEVAADITNSTWSGRLEIAAPDALQLQSDLPEAWRLDGPMTATATLGGTFEKFHLDTAIAGSAFTWAGQSYDGFTATAVITEDAIDVSALHIDQGQGALDGTVRYAWDSGAYTADLKGEALTWNATVLAPNDTQATFSAEFAGSGTTARPGGRAASTFTLKGGQAGALIDTGTLAVDFHGDGARFTVRLPSLGATVDGDVATATPYAYRASAVLDHLELARVAPLAGVVENEILGFMSGTVTASGRLADDRDRVAVLDLSAIDAAISGVPVSLNAPAKISLRGTDVTLQGLDMKVGAGKLIASGEWRTSLDGTFQGSFTGDFQDAVRMGRAFGVPMTVDGTGAMAVEFRSSGNRATTVAKLTVKDGTFNWGGGPAVVRHLDVDAALDGESLTVSHITGSVATGGVVGDFSASGKARVPTLDLAAIDGELTVDAARFTFSGIPVEQQRPSRFQFAKGTVTASDVTWSVAENPLTLSGSVAFAPNPDPALDLSVKGIVDLRVLSALVSTMAFDGNARVDAQIKGTLAKPALAGRIDLDSAEIALSDPRLVLSELSGPITLAGDRIVIAAVKGFANGGNIALDGVLEVAGLTLSGGSINIQAQGVALELPKGLRSEFDGLITFHPDPKAPSVTGDVRIVQSSYTDTISLAALARQATLPVSPMIERPYLDRMRLDLAITTTEDITVDNNYGRLEAGASIRVVGTVAQPGVDGRITLREGGEVFLAGRTFRITRGDISFTDLRRIHPEFNIAAEATINSKDVTMTLTGTLERPQIDLAELGGSQTPGELAAEIVGTSNSDAAIALLSADLLGVTGRAIGLDAFRVEQGSYSDRDFRNKDFQEDPTLAGNNKLDPTTRLTIGKRLSDQVEVTVSQNLRESGKTTFIISYLPKHNVEIRALSQDNATLSIGIRHQVTLGPGSASRRVERRVRPTVKAITFVNVDPQLEAESRNHLRVKPGDQFDFLKLQRDIDRLRESFHTRGYYEARVRTRRVEDTEANEVTLEYRVEQGPRTILQVVGITLPASEEDDLKEAWGHTTFDRFLIDEITHRVRRYLVTTGELNSVVVGTVDRSAADTKRLRIDVTPGVPVSGREIRFSGNAGIDSKRLEAEIRTAGVELEAWLDRTVVERTVRSFYNEEGFLKAEVTAGPLEIDGSVGVLPVTVVDGPRATVTDLKLAGVAEGRVPAVQKAADLALPRLLINSEIGEARRRIERFYRAQGFNAAEIELRPQVAADDTVTLNVEVVEGPQQVLAEVVTTGDNITQGNVITEALHFELGKPVDLDEWAQARKRLYDTNVFRQVDVQAVNAGEAKDGVQPVKAQVTVEEYPPWSLRYGTQLEGERTPNIDEFTSSRNLGVVAEIKNPNLFGRALTLGLFGQYQRSQQDASLFLATSRLFGWRARSSLYGFFAREDIRDDLGAEIVAVTDRQGISADQRWHVRGFQVVYGYRFERNRTFDPSPSPNDPFPLDFVANLARLSAAALLDRRDDPLNPTKGTFSSVSSDYSALWLGSDVVNRKVLMQQYLFLPIGSRLVLASRAQSGLVFGPDDLLPSDRFRAGGATTVRGYGEDGLGPRDELGIPKGGETLLVLNQEARFPIYGWVQGVGFVDAGNIFGKGEPFKWNELKVGYGFGLRINTPVGLLRVDYGIARSPLSPSQPPNSLTDGRFTFGFGHIF